MKKVVTIGGGTGSYTVLRGLKEFPLSITAVISMFDSGGSSGMLRDEYGVLPPGDIRRGLLALSEGKRSEILRELFNFRFEGKGGLSGHNFGNLFLVALSSIYGGDAEAIQKASELLHIKGRVLPVSLDKSDLHAILEDGTKIVGETNIDVPKHNADLKIQKLLLDPPATLHDKTDAAIRAADLIVIGPGDPYSSVIPNLLVVGMKESLAARKGKTVAVCNLMTKWGETKRDASATIREVLAYSGITKFDYILCNTGRMDEELVATYAKAKQYPVVCDEGLAHYADKVITGDFFSEADIARHDSAKVAKIISEL